MTRRPVMPVARWIEARASATANKYNAKATVVDGIRFASKAEARRWCALRLLERAGQISDLQRQVRFELVPAAVSPSGKRERAVVYVADFVYRDEAGARVVEDVKGVRTAAYRTKRRLMLAVHGIEIKET